MRESDDTMRESVLFGVAAPSSLLKGARATQTPFILLQQRKPRLVLSRAFRV